MISSSVCLLRFMVSDNALRAPQTIIALGSILGEQINLIESGYSIVRSSVSKNGPATVLSNGKSTYTVYTRTSTGSSGAQLTDAAGNILVKIILK